MESCVKRGEDVGREYKENPNPKYIRYCNKGVFARSVVSNARTLASRECQSCNHDGKRM